ncbi:MAG: hypothetical protein IT312_08605 [Anaerolineales bacterium]|nr:hypothetical protein [Anaerolineales bacterium]
MSNKNKFLASVGFYVLVGGLLFYAASRTLHFVQNVMAESIWGYLFLLSTGGGALIWLFVYLSLAQGAKQRAVSFAMGLLDLLGELALVYADTIFVGNEAGLVTMTQDEMKTFVIVSVAIVGLNIFAGYMFKLWDLKAEQDQQAQDLVDHVTSETIKQLNTPEAKRQMANDLAPVLSASIKARVTAEVFDRASANQAIDARAAGWPIGTGENKKEIALPLVLPPADGTSRGLWMQSITAKDGTKKRAFCLECLKAGKSWVGGELCEHFESAEVVGAESKLDSPSQGSGAS